MNGHTSKLKADSVGQEKQWGGCGFSD